MHFGLCICLQAPVVGQVSRIPRFGKTHDFGSLGYLFNDKESSEGEDYLIGLSFMAGAIMVLFLIWWFFLFISKCCCRSFLGGNPFTAPNASEEDFEKPEEKVKANSTIERRAFRTRIGKSVVFLTSVNCTFSGTNSPRLCHSSD